MCMQSAGEVRRAAAAAALRSARAWSRRARACARAPLGQTRGRARLGCHPGSGPRPRSRRAGSTPVARGGTRARTRTPAHAAARAVCRTALRSAAEAPRRSACSAATSTQDTSKQHTHTQPRAHSHAHSHAHTPPHLAVVQLHEHVVPRLQAVRVCMRAQSAALAARAPWRCEARQEQPHAHAGALLSGWCGSSCRRITCCRQAKAPTAQARVPHC
jgi:hypothetical protein